MAFRFLSVLRPNGVIKQGPISLALQSFHSSKPMKAENLYKTLGLSHEATQREIKEAFYALSKLYHPDISIDEASHAKFQKISNAYDVLGDPSKRVDYDRGLVIPKPHKANSEFPSKVDLDTLRKADSGSFESHYVKQYNKQLQNIWSARADVNISKSAFDFRHDQRNFVSILYLSVFGTVLVGYLIAKSNEEPIPLMKLDDA